MYCNIVISITAVQNGQQIFACSAAVLFYSCLLFAILPSLPSLSLSHLSLSIHLLVCFPDLCCPSQLRAPFPSVHHIHHSRASLTSQNTALLSLSTLTHCPIVMLGPGSLAVTFPRGVGGI
ncbi:hypothetical protein XENTR_v10009245 [Xenopus tropicalis]|nr:hypothetical protein XENTR_v10009245 [Xenopus tropicalis]